MVTQTSYIAEVRGALPYCRQPLGEGGWRVASPWPGVASDDDKEQHKLATVRRFKTRRGDEKMRMKAVTVPAERGGGGVIKSTWKHWLRQRLLDLSDVCRKYDTRLDQGQPRAFIRSGAGTVLNARTSVTQNEIPGGNSI